MKTVLAAIDTNLTAGPVLATASALARLLGAEVQPVHVRVETQPGARVVVEAAGLDLTELSGDPVEALVDAVSAGEAAAIVLGVRATPGGRRPAGGTALAVAARAPKPVVLVPPDAPRAGRLERVLVPLEGSIASAHAPRSVIELAAGAHVDVVVLHVLEEAALPAFTDQPQHETHAWAQEFLARYCPWAAKAVRFEWRVGRCDEMIAAAVEETNVDLVAMGWAQDLATGRAPVVRSVLARAHVPVLLLPVIVNSPTNMPERLLVFNAA